MYLSNCLLLVDLPVMNEGRASKFAEVAPVVKQSMNELVGSGLPEVIFKSGDEYWMSYSK
jgi:hypothetical protein